MTQPAQTETHAHPLSLDGGAHDAEFGRLWQALEALTDPEIPVITLREMGILRELRRAADGTMEVVITPTYSGCPAMEQIADDIAKTLKHVGVSGRVVTQLAPAWTTDWMTDEAREKLRAYGIAPPHCASVSADEAVVRFAPARPAEPVPCPLCGSSNTTETSHFGSTACKALFRCLDCMEPFDYFKRI